MKLQNFYLFSNVDTQSLQNISRNIIEKKFSHGNIIFYKGDSSENLHLLVKGSVKMYKYNSNDEEILLHYFNAESLIGEMATFEDIPYPANCMAESDVTIWSIKKDDFILALHNNPNLALKIIFSMSTKIKILEQSIDLNISKNSMQRVVSLILYNKEIFEQRSRIKIASMLNMKQETLSRVIKKLKDSHAIAIKNKVITILNQEVLEKNLQ
ncbi:MAG: Crp/Fnr family transcriptional regulator [Epsilonproteobacteria bacterium]|nr:Crp/Fnr family transcriptional regulator [Campylobacterota bacterium]OIO15967.1 MAG: hypothetical protein AUJ81_05805 [Helicobacteraceae bacterium CG1_02_36_14]PIP10595.1 MAG: Crp/Fnr family transcriptional regulator [Sulfurimonas sp. CG23_combo_of_CG06-09_8_20_14_all_36_33]PIS24327.1 MAG: Crp/Fnr family transcriptional regulator [Sulfurimonas sp. CG08_land_8_20_14_0_20_36_33]PIU36259.1 MAG: Crp/Fnr family transcriptional regulator [Sulfurimonas sp. CG07_land_8_20_14_0_80_36_56]PIV04278.1 M